MCWNPVSNVAEVWCCSEHCLWLFDDGHAVICEDAKTTLASGLQTLSLKRESNTVLWCVRPWIKFIPEYPFKKNSLGEGESVKVSYEYRGGYISLLCCETRADRIHDYLINGGPRRSEGLLRLECSSLVIYERGGKMCNVQCGSRRRRRRRRHLMSSTHTSGNWQSTHPLLNVGHTSLSLGMLAP